MHTILYVLCIAVILLLTNCIPAYSIPSNSKHIENILFVGGTGPGNYTKIQYAIDNATDGTTIYVYKNIYFETILINKTLTLIGQDKHTTIIQGNYTNTTIKITADYTNISNFTITQGGQDYYTAGILIQANHTTISHNIIINNKKTGIRIPNITNDGTIYTTITHNLITNNQVGIYLQLCGHTLITYNIITNNTNGIHTQVGFLTNGCENTTIYHNHLENNNLGIDLFSGWETTIKCNNFIHNKRHATFNMETDAIWDQNYWDHPRLFPKIILGKNRFFIFTYPYLNFDRNPTQIPNITGDMP